MRHEQTLDNYGIDPVDPLAKTPFLSSVSLGTYGSYWAYIKRMAPQLLFDVDRIAYDYKVFSGNAPDAFGAYILFGFQSYFLCFYAAGDTIVDYTINNIDPIITTQKNWKYFEFIQVTGFRIRNTIPGSNVQYQLVVFR
jgi:hypothetical protein